MNINIQYGNTPIELSYQNWNVGFIGADIDDRGNEAVKFLQEKSDCLYKIVYDPNEYIITINNESIHIDDIDTFFEEKFSTETNFILDCTTLGVPEILILIQSIYNQGYKHFDSLYLEPINYRNYESKFISKRDFELSDRFYGYIGIPGNTLSLSTDNTDKAVFCCGYEAERIERAFEDLNLSGEKSQIVFGVPAFHAGWEINSFSNNIYTIDNRNLNKNFYYCGASNPSAIYEQLNSIYHGLEENEHLFIVPIGTKPMSLGACLFKVITNDNCKIAILYDHPIKKSGRSSMISRWNLYNIAL